jgi:hypothetical protein
MTINFEVVLVSSSSISDNKYNVFEYFSCEFSTLTISSPLLAYPQLHIDLLVAE